MFVVVGAFVTMTDVDLFLKVTDKDGHKFDLRIYVPPTFAPTLKSHLKDGCIVAVKGHFDAFPESNNPHLTAQKVTFLSSGEEVE